MATKLDTTLGASVLAILKELGAPLTYFVPSAAGAYDPQEGDVVGATEAEHSVISLPPSAFGVRWQEFSQLQQAELVTGFAGKGAPFSPEPGFTVLVAGRRYVCESVVPIFSGADVALWLFGLRRGGGRDAG